MSARTPFVIVPWHTDFVAALHRRINVVTEHHAERAVVVFPHDRPRRYLVEAFRREGRALMLPRMLTVRELFASLRPAGTNGQIVREAGLIDRIALLHACCRDAVQPGEPLAGRMLQGGEAAFFPWGERLAALLEECLSQDVTPTDLHHAEAEVAPFGAELLAALGRIFRLYVERLPQSGRTTPGLDASMAALSLNASMAALSLDASLGAAAPPSVLHGKSVFLAGFHTLTGTEERVFRRLWDSGAHILLHSDPALTQNVDEIHWSCSGHARWISKWRAGVELVNSSSEADIQPARKPRLHFFAGYDLHSQLEQLAQDLRTDAASSGDFLRANPEGSVAVALTHPELLLPVLHHLPDKDCNVSLGYPFERTPLYRLLDLVLLLEEQRLEDGRVPWRVLDELTGHPWLRLLRPLTPEQGERASASFAGVLHKLGARIRGGGRFQNPESVLTFESEPSVFPVDAAPAEPSLVELLDQVREHCVQSWRRAASLADMAVCLAGLAELLAKHGQDVWRRFPLDAECLTRMVQRIIPALRDNDLAEAPLPAALRHSLLRALLRAERVPFEADPIVGPQVLGMLETRLLRFSRVFVVDATEDTLPGPQPRDPLLPDSLRSLIGLPDAQHRDQLAAHTLYRLLAGADEVYLYWQEGVHSSGLLDTASQRSRLIEELIWRHEQQTGRLLELGEPPLRAAAPRLKPPRRQRLSLARTPALHARMAAVLAEGLTPGRLDAYLTCPLAFHYSYVAGLATPDAVNEGDDPVAVGELLHATLHEAYTPWLHRTLRRGDISPEDLSALFCLHAARMPHLADLPPESTAMLALAGPERLRRYLRAQPEQTIVRCLEQPLSAACVPDDPDSPVLRGRLDRVDEREGAVILDYKTGRLKRIDQALWTDEQLWSRLHTWLAKQSADQQAHSDEGDSLLLELAVRAPSLQLPAYIHLFRRSPDVKKMFATSTLSLSAGVPGLVDAAWVDLGENGREFPLFGSILDETAREEAVSEKIPLLLAFVVRHMRTAAYFRSHEGAHCGWCSFRNLCMVTE